METCELLDCLKLKTIDARRKEQEAEEPNEQVYWRGFAAGLETASDEVREKIRRQRLMALPD